MGHLWLQELQGITHNAIDSPLLYWNTIDRPSNEAFLSQGLVAPIELGIRYAGVIKNRKWLLRLNF